MSPFQKLKEHLLLKVPLGEGEWGELASCFTEKKVKRKQYIIQPDFVAKSRNYVVQGSFRAFVVDKKGIDHTIQFAIEDWWISDYNSYVNQTPATMFVEALEDSHILQIDYECEKRLKATHHTYETLFRIMAERSASFHQRRIISSLTQSAEERYNEFIDKYPDVVLRLPQYALASYLGMTTGFLSRIRNDKLKKS